MKKELLYNKSTLFKKACIFILLSFSVFIISCDRDQEQTADDLRGNISELRRQITGKEREITLLEQKLRDMGEPVAANDAATRVSVIELQPQRFNHYLKTAGIVEAVNEAIISPEASGQIKQILVEKGQSVKAGQTVARLNTSVIENNIEEVESSLALAETFYERQKRLYEQEIGSEMQYLEAKNSYKSLQSRLNSLKSQLEMSIIRAPLNGIIDDIFIKEGELAMPNTRLMQIVNLDDLYVNADISETYLPHINKNSEVILRFPVYRDYEKTMHIDRVSNYINPVNRTFRVQLKIENPGGKIKPNMVGNMSIMKFDVDSAVVIPSVLIRQDIQGHYVYVAKPGKHESYFAKKRYIERGLSSEGKTTIKEGLKAGDLVIDKGSNRVQDGEQIDLIK